MLSHMLPKQIQTTTIPNNIYLLLNHTPACPNNHLNNFTLTHIGKAQNHTLKNTIPSWLHDAHAPSQDVNALPNYNRVYFAFMAQHPHIVTPHPNSKVQFIEFTSCNDKFPQATTTKKLEKLDILQTTLYNKDRQFYLQ